MRLQVQRSAHEPRRNSRGHHTYYAALGAIRHGAALGHRPLRCPVDTWFAAWLDAGNARPDRLSDTLKMYYPERGLRRVNFARLCVGFASLEEEP